MTKRGRPPLWEEYRPEWVRLYCEEKQSRGQIAREHDTSVQTVTRQLVAVGVDLEARQGPNRNAERTAEEQAAINAKISANRTGKGTGPRVEREQRTCVNPRCGESYTYIPGRTGTKYCSKACQMSTQAQRTAAEAQADYEADPRRCPCGEPIPYEFRHNRIYCSPEHRTQYQAKRSADPANHVTFTCQNEACGKEVTRPRSWGKGYFKFCSNACAQKHTKTRRFYAVEDFDIVFESSYETLFWSLCAFLKVPVERFDRENGIAWGEGGWYAPDFWLPFLSTAVEVKGVEDENDQARWEAFRQQHSRLVVVDDLLLDDLRHAQTAHEIEALLA